MTNGQITLNGITDKQLIILLEVKSQHEGHINFTPQQMQPQVTQGQPPVQHYNNVILTWHAEQGVEAIKELLHKLTHKE